MEWGKIAGKRIEEERKAKGLTQKELAEKLSVRREEVKNWECFNRKPNVDMLIRLSEILGVTVDYLTGRSESKLPADSSITILTNRFGFSAKAARELSVLSNAENGEWARMRFAALNRLIEKADYFEGILIGLWGCMTYAQTLTYYEAELIKQGQHLEHIDGYVTKEELSVRNDRSIFRNATIYGPQSLLAQIAEQFINESEEQAQKETASGAGTSKAAKGRKTKSSAPEL